MYAAAAFGAPGETWDVTTKSADVQGGGIFPEVTVTVCLPPGGSKDPQQFLQQKEDCRVTDVKSSGKKTTWKMQCGSGDDEMTGSGEVTYGAASFQGQTKLQGKSAGEPVNMKVTYQGRKVGAPCDTSAPPVVKGMEGLGDIMSMAKSQMTSAMAEQCEVANHHPTDLISPRFFGPNAACVGKEKAACKVIAKAVAKDPVAFVKLSKFEDTSDLGIAKTCNIDMAAAAKAICAKVNADNYHDFADYCPDQVKAFSKQQAPPVAESRNSGASGGSGGGTVNSVIDNAIKLKGLFGF